MSHIARRTQGAVIYCEHVRPSPGGSNPSWLVRSKVPSSSTRPQGHSCTLSPGHTLSDCLCLARQTPWLGPPPQSLSLWHSAPRESVSGAPAVLSLPRHPAVTSHTAACCHIVRCRQRQCHCHRRAQRGPTLPLTFTLSPSTAPLPRSFSCRLFRDTAPERVKALQETPSTPSHPSNQSRLAAHSNQTSFPRYPLLEIWTPPAPPLLVQLHAQQDRLREAAR